MTNIMGTGSDSLKRKKKLGSGPLALNLREGKSKKWQQKSNLIYKSILLSIFKKNQYLIFIIIFFTIVTGSI